MADEPQMVCLQIDGRKVRVPKGTNLIDAAEAAGIEIPHYCYHKHLSVAGNCRMCQVQIEGMRKMEIACNTGAADGMVVSTHHTSQDVAEAQRAVLEFLLINHPLDCTVCDQAGHCKLQDYYYQYNTKPSRFSEEKERHTKAEPLGPEVIYDGERCIVCTRCVRFCEEISGTGELGVFHRGDKSVIGTYPGVELKNPFSGTVCDLCPVGALTHRRWRFNSRIWFADKHESICTGCSTGCNMSAAVRDGKLVYIESRLNSEVNKGWLCDEGRYGFERFQPNSRLPEPAVKKNEDFENASWEEAYSALKGLAQGEPGGAAVFLSPFLTFEEVWLALEFAKNVMGVEPQSGSIAMQLRTRDLSELESMLISPDMAPNARTSTFFGLSDGGDNWRASVEASYDALLNTVRSGGIERVLLIGEGAVLEADADADFCKALQEAKTSAALTPRDSGRAKAESNCRVLLPTSTVNEKSGVMLNRDVRFQRLKALFDMPVGAKAEWQVLAELSRSLKKSILPDSVSSERELFRHLVKQVEALSDLSYARIGDFGVSLSELAPESSQAVQPEAE